MATIPIIHARAQANAPQLTARATPAQFGKQVAEQTRAFARSRGAGEREVRRAEVGVGRGDLQVAEAQTFAAQSKTRDVADLVRTAGRVGDVAKNAYITVQEYARRDQKIEAQRLASEHGTQVMLQEAELRQSAAADGSGHSDATMSAFDKSSQALLDGAQSNYQRRLLEQHLIQQRATLERSAGRFEIRARQEKRREDVVSVLDALETEAVAVRDDEEGAEVNVGTETGGTPSDRYNEVMARAVDVINGSNLRPTEKRKLLRSTRKNMTQIAVNAVALDDPIAALELLQDPQVLTAVGGDVIALQRRVEAALGRKAAATAREEKVFSEEANKEGEELISAGNFGETLQPWLSANKHILSGTDFAKFQRIARGGVRESDPEVFKNILQLVDRGQFELARAANVDALSFGQLKNEDFSKNLHDIQQAKRLIDSQSLAAQKRGEGLPPWARLQRSTLATALQPDKWAYDPEAQFKVALAQGEYTDAVLKNPAMGFAKGRELWNEIIKQYKDSSTRQTQNAPFAPMGLQNVLKEKVTAKQLQDAKKEIEIFAKRQYPDNPEEQRAFLKKHITNWERYSKQVREAQGGSR